MVRGKNPAQNWVLITAMLILAICLLPMVIDQVQSINTASWNFTGHQGASTLLNLLPFVFICGIIIYFIGSLLGKT
jgi:hypothetical protein